MNQTNCSDAVKVAHESYTGSLSSNSFNENTWFFPTLNVVCKYTKYHSGKEHYSFYGKGTVPEELRSEVIEFLKSK